MPIGETFVKGGAMPKAGPGPSQGPSDVKFLKCSSNRGGYIS